MTEEEFVNGVREELLAGYFPGEDGKEERLEPEYVEELLAKRTWSGNCTLVHERFVNMDPAKSERFWIEGTASILWTEDNC